MTDVFNKDNNVVSNVSIKNKSILWLRNLSQDINCYRNSHYENNLIDDVTVT